MTQEILAHRQSRYKASRYNWILPIEEEGGGGAVYNAYTGACLALGPDDFERVRVALSDPNGRDISFRTLGESATKLGGTLIAGGFLIESEFDELRDFEARTANRSDGLPLVMTINPTFACNLGCGYCFVAKKQGLMSEETEKELIAFVERQLSSGDVPSMHVDWFGGEPLLARRSMERLSKAFLALCAARSIPYSAQVITNATLLNTELADQLAAWGVNRLQITLDGNRATHNARRPWKGISVKVTSRSSYDDTLRGIENVIGRFTIRLRLNVDRHNLDEAFSLLEMFDAKGWLSAGTKFLPYLAPLSDFTEAAANGWSPSQACELDAFYEAHSKWLDYLNARGVPVVRERLYGFPEPTTVACGAVSERGWVVNFDGELHKCGLDSDTESRAVGTIRDGEDPHNENSKYWSSYEPVADPTCRACPALPVCLGGCARDRRENRSTAMAHNCEIHLKHEPRIIAQHIRLLRQNRRRLSTASSESHKDAETAHS